MACDTTQLLQDAKCILTCVPAGMIPAVSLAALCNITGGTMSAVFVAKTGDTMSGSLVLPSSQTALQLGGTTSSFPALGNSGALAQFRLADNSNYANVQVGFLQANDVDANNNTQPVALECYHDTVGGGGANSCGVSIDFRADSDTTDRQQQVRISSLWLNATHAARTADLRIFPTLNGVSTEALRISNTLVDARGGTFFGVAGTQVVGARNTGWATFGAGASNKNAAALDTATVTTAQLAQIVKAMMDMMITHGLIGP